MPTYVANATVETGHYQNAQELAAIWGDIQTDLEEHNCELIDAYVLLGQQDLLLLFEAEEHEDVIQASIAVQRYGISMDTMEALNVNRLGEIVDEV